MASLPSSPRARRGRTAVAYDQAVKAAECEDDQAGAHLSERPRQRVRVAISLGLVPPAGSARTSGRRCTGASFGGWCLPPGGRVAGLESAQAVSELLAGEGLGL